MNPVTSFLVLAFVAAAFALGYWVNLYLGLALLVAAALIGSSLKMANLWQKFVILRLGKLQSVRGAGLFAIIPVIDSVIAIIDARIQTTAFNAEQADCAARTRWQPEQGEWGVGLANTVGGASGYPRLNPQ